MIAVTPVEEISAKAVTRGRLIMGGNFPYVAPAGVSVAALDRADDIQSGAGRRTSAPVRKWFVRSVNDEIPMLARLYSGSGRGGRSGYISIKVLLTLLWKTSKPPFETVMTAPALAELLDLPDPAVKGARRVRDALRALSDAKLIRLLPRPGTSPRIQLMNEMGTEEEYTLPSTSYVRSMMKKSAQESATDPNLYFQLPAELWTEGFFQKLKGPGLVMLLILLAEQANRRPVWFSGAEFTERYRISPSTRTKGTQELIDLGILITTSVPLPATWGESSFEQKRRRFEYRLTGVIGKLGNGEKEADPAPKPAEAKKAKVKTTPETTASKKPVKYKRRKPRKLL